MNDHRDRLSYAAAGVDIDAGELAVDRIRRAARETFTPNVLSDIGAFGGMYRLDAERPGETVLVASADGVGTKLKLAFMTGRHDTVGEDLVNHCVNDILVQGARPLFFLDYIATGKLTPQVVADLVTGMARGCRLAGMPLLGGETAEMPDFYALGEYDVAGFIVGQVARDHIVTGETIQEGDVILGLASSGLHTNGYSLARRIAFDVANYSADDTPDGLDQPLGDILLTTHRSYAPALLPILGSGLIHGMAHITGGGIPGNLSRIIPDNLGATIDTTTWVVPPIFEWLARTGSVDSKEMFRVFNMGVGYICVVAAQEAEQVATQLRNAGETVWTIGTITPSQQKVTLT